MSMKMMLSRPRAGRTPRPVGNVSRDAAVLEQGRRVRRLRVSAAVLVIWTVLTTTLWVLGQWRSSGAFRHFGNTDRPGDWNPTLWVLGLGAGMLIVGIMALRVYFERPPTAMEVAREADRLRPLQMPDGAGGRVRLANARLQRLRRLKFHVAAWVFGMVVLTPLWALIEWQDNGDFKRWSSDSQPGSWDPWILPVGGVWAAVIAIFALQVFRTRNAPR